VEEEAMMFSKRNRNASNLGKQRWRILKHVRPERGQQVLLYSPELRGAQWAGDDGVRLGYYKGGYGTGKLQASPHLKGVIFQRWLPYAPPPRVGRAPRMELTPDMLMAVDKLGKARASGRLRKGALIDHRKLGISLTTMNALLHRRLIRFNRKAVGGFFLE
jgi:hypothetical protein